MFDVLKVFIKVLWSKYSECSSVKAYYEARFDFVVVGVEIYLIAFVYRFSVDFKS